MTKNLLESEKSLHSKYMSLAIELAKKGTGWTNPNPLVGAVIVKDGKIIGQGYHHKYGELHAEREALKNCREAGNNPCGATIYVTLEPCCHFGKQPPCTHALVEAGIKKVFVGSRDPNPLVHGKGNSYLREQGIEVTEDFMREECDELNPVFFHYISTKMPYVALKYAMTLDGKIATKTGESKWITGEESRNFVQELRNQYAGIMCGLGTVLADNPMLNCRIEGGANPVRIVCDSKLNIPVDCQLVETAREIPLIVACCENSFDQQKKLMLEEKGVEIIEVPADENGSVNVKELFKILGSKKIDSVLVEGGGNLNFSILKSGIVNKIYAFVAPKIFGGEAKSPVNGEGILHPADAFTFSLKQIRQIGNDILLSYEK